MYFSAIFAIFCVFHIHSVRSALMTEKIKLSQISAVQNDACPPGVWTCSTGKRSEINTASPETKVSFNENTVAKETTHSDDYEDPQDCPPGMWVCKKKKLLKQMLKRALIKSRQDGVNPSQVSNDACPPGVWTCSTGE